MLISIIIPTYYEKNNITVALDRLAEQAANYEIIVVDSDRPDNNPLLIENRAKIASAPEATLGAQLNAGAAAATGDVLFFLDPRNRLPPDALLAIERNLKLLPQTIGGNFHLKFDRDTFFTRFLVHFLKWRRYQGNYWGNSGIFIRKHIYEAIGGFQSNVVVDYDFVRRMEKYGPTLYLPETIIGPVPKYREALTWLIAPILVKRKT